MPQFKLMIKKICVLYLILSLTFFSPISFAIAPIVQIGVSAIAGALAGGAGKKLLKKIGLDLLGGDSDSELDDDGVTFFLLGSKYCLHDDTRYCADNPSQAKSVYNARSIAIHKDEKARNTATSCYFEKRSVHIRCDLIYQGKPGYSTLFLCMEKCDKKRKDYDEMLEEVKKRKDKGDKDAEEVYNQAKKNAERDREDDDDDDDDKNKPKDKDDDDDKPKDKGDDDDKKKPKDKDKGDDDDDDNPPDDECKHQDDDKKQSKDKGDDKQCQDKPAKDKGDDDDDSTCHSSAFHKKVCDWIDWTYDETDKAKKKIADFFNDDELNQDKKKLGQLVDETEVPLKQYDFDVADACPVPRSVTTSFLGRTIEIEVFNFEGVCRYAGYIEFALKTTATIIGLNIIAGRKME